MTHHFHTWQPNPEGAYVCTECDTTSPECINPGHPTENHQAICDPCRAHEQRVLDDIKQALTEYQPRPKTYVSAYTWDVIPVREHRETSAYQLRAVDIPEVLQTWAGMWAENIGELAPKTKITEYLKSRFTWATNNPDTSAWGDYQAEMRALRHLARGAAGLLPQKLDTPCVNCGGTVVQDWATLEWRPRPTGLSDQIRCTTCHTTWPNHVQWQLDNARHLRKLPQLAPGALITMREARIVFPGIPAGTWRQWKHRDTLTPRGADEYGNPLFEVHEINQLAENRKKTRRH